MKPSLIIDVIEDYYKLDNIEELISHYPQDRIPPEAKKSLSSYTNKDYRITFHLLTLIIHDIISGKFYNNKDTDEIKSVLSELVYYLVYEHNPVDVGDFPLTEYNLGNARRLIKKTENIDDDNPLKWTYERYDMLEKFYREGLLYHAYFIYYDYYYAWYLHKVRKYVDNFEEVDEEIIKLKKLVDTILSFDNISFWFSNYKLFFHHEFSEKENIYRYNQELLNFFISHITEEYIDIKELFFDEMEFYKVNKPLSDEELYKIIIPRDPETGKIIALLDIGEKEEYIYKSLKERELLEKIEL